MAKPYSFIDLFAGVGGFHLALHQHADCVFVSEWDTYARKTYSLNFGTELTERNVRFEGDITKVPVADIPDHTVLCGGFPCQPFSIAGEQKGFKHATQGTLFFNILNIISQKTPRVVFLENVKNLVAHDKGNTFKVITKALEAEGYTVKHQVLNGTTHGNIPQNRERIFIVAFKIKEEADQFEFPSPIPLTATLSSKLATEKQEAKYYQTDTSSPSVEKMLKEVTKKGSIYQYRRYYLRENKTNVCPTLTANMGGGGHNVPLILDNYGVRKLTPRECFNLQGFPDYYKLPDMADSHLYKQAGNSVVMPVVKRIADEIFNVLLSCDKQKKVKK